MPAPTTNSLPDSKTRILESARAELNSQGILGLRVSEVAKLMVDSGLIVISALVSPFEVDRQRAKSIFEDGEFLEIFIDTPVEICRSRDPKGLYKKSAAGEIPNFTGVGQDYERPSHPDLVIDGTAPIDESVEKILKILL